MQAAGQQHVPQQQEQQHPPQSQGQGLLSDGREQSSISQPEFPASAPVTSAPAAQYPLPPPRHATCPAHTSGERCLVMLLACYPGINLLCNALIKEGCMASCQNNHVRLVMHACAEQRHTFLEKNHDCCGLLLLTFPMPGHG